MNPLRLQSALGARLTCATHSGVLRPLTLGSRSLYLLCLSLSIYPLISVTCPLPNCPSICLLFYNTKTKHCRIWRICSICWFLSPLIKHVYLFLEYWTYASPQAPLEDACVVHLLPRLLLLQERQCLPGGRLFHSATLFRHREGQPAIYSSPVLQCFSLPVLQK